MAGAPLGSRNAARGTEWRDAIRYELAKIGRELDGDDPAYRKGLRQCAEQFIQAAQMGEPWAIKELADRTDGKAPQAVELYGKDGGDIGVKGEVTILPTSALDKVDEDETEG